MSGARLVAWYLSGFVQWLQLKSHPGRGGRSRFSREEQQEGR